MNYYSNARSAFFSRDAVLREEEVLEAEVVVVVPVRPASINRSARPF